MAGLPDEREYTAAPDTQLTAAFVNKAQDSIIAHENILRGPYATLNEDFWGPGIDESIWDISGAGSAFTQETDTGAMGALKATLGSSISNVIATVTLDIGTLDFDMEFRVRTTSSGGTGSHFYMGIVQIGGGSTNALFRSNSDGTWDLILGGSIVSTNFTAVSSTYKTFRLKRVSGVAYAFVNGVQFYTGAFALSLSGATQAFAIQIERQTSGTETDWVDAAKLTVARGY